MKVIYNFLLRASSNVIFNRIILTTCILVTIYLIYFYFSQEGRDERGRQIFGESAFTGFIVYILISNLLPFLIDGNSIVNENFLFVYSGISYFSLVVPMFIVLHYKKRHK